MKKYLVVIKQENKSKRPNYPFFRNADTKEEAEDIIRMWKYPITEAKIYKEVEA